MACSAVRSTRRGLMDGLRHTWSAEVAVEGVVAMTAAMRPSKTTSSAGLYCCNSTIVASAEACGTGTTHGAVAVGCTDAVGNTGAMGSTDAVCGTDALRDTRVADTAGTGKIAVVVMVGVERWMGR